MVGVPGRSKGCATCRKRKKGCDLQRPACGQCAKSGLQCAGYERQCIFINHAAVASSNALVTTSQAAGPSQTPSRRPTQAFDLPPRGIVLPDALTRSAYELKSLGLFWETYLPRGRAFTAFQGQFTTGSWLGAVDCLYHRDDTLKHALLAMSLGTVGQRLGDPWMIQQGIISHGHALRTMALAVQSPDISRRDEVLAATRLLALLEILFGANDQDKFAQARSWSSHVEGELILLKARGPHAHMSGLAHRLFADGRLSAIISATRSRRRTVLSNPEWKEVPWLAMPKTPKDALLDIMVEIPAVLENLDGIEGARSLQEKHLLAERVLQSCWALDVQLTEWVLNINAVANLDLDSLAHVADTGDIAIAHIIYLYWVTCMFVSRILALANGDCVEPQLLPPRFDERVYARKIARSASYFFQKEMGTWSANASSFPIGIALSVLCDAAKQGGEDRELIMSVLSQGDAGDAIGKFLNSMRAWYIVAQCRPRGPP